MWTRPHLSVTLKSLILSQGIPLMSLGGFGNVFERSFDDPPDTNPIPREHLMVIGLLEHLGHCTYAIK